jgi:L-fucose isomerase
LGTIGILSFSDGRKRVHDGLAPYITDCEKRLVRIFEEDGGFKTVTGQEIIWNAELARTEADRLSAAQVDGIILNVPVFAFPNYSLIAAMRGRGPYLGIAPINGKFPGLGGLLAATNLLHQNGIYCDKVWGNPEDPETRHKLLVFARASRAVNRLKGSVYGLFGGRSIGMGTGAVNPDLWMEVFGVDTEHVDQLEIIRRAGLVDPAETDRAFRWLTEKAGKILYDGDKLTEETFKFQIACYLATKEIVKERKIDFLGVKCHYDLSEYQTAQCVAADFMNDPWDWDGPKEPTVYSCEADSDGALTMQVMKLVSGLPVMFVDFRHYDEKEKVFAFTNCGAFASWYAARSENPEENLKHVTFHPLIPKYAGKGAHVQFIAREGAMTLGRLTHTKGRYKFTLFRGEIVSMPAEKVAETCPQWPHAFIRVKGDPYALIQSYENNHVHGVFGDYIAELEKFSEIIGIDCEVLS